MSKDFEAALAEKPKTEVKVEGVEQDFFNHMRNMVGDTMLSDQQAQQLSEDLKGSYKLLDDNGEMEISDDLLSINLKDEVYQQIVLLKALRKALFFESGAPRPDTEAAEIRGYLSSSIQLLNLLQRFEEALKTDADVRAIESSLEAALDELAELHPESTMAIEFAELVAKRLGIASDEATTEVKE